MNSNLCKAPTLEYRVGRRLAKLWPRHRGGLPFLVASDGQLKQFALSANDQIAGLVGLPPVFYPFA